MSNFDDGNHALLMGMIMGLVQQLRDDKTEIICPLEDGNYTNRILIKRPSGGKYVLTLTKVADDTNLE